MRTIRLAVLAIALGIAGLSFSVAAHADDAGVPDASVTGDASIATDASVATSAGSGSTQPAPAPHESLDNPVTNPVAAWDDAKAAKKIGWTALVFALATMLAMGLGTLGKNLKQLAWLGKGRAAVVVGGVVAVGAAGFDVAVSGGSPVALALALWTAGLAYWNSQKATATEPAK